MADRPANSIAEHLAWLGIESCTCSHEWRSYGRLHGVSMGKGWVRMDTVADCPHHGIEAHRG